MELSRRELLKKGASGSVLLLMPSVLLRLAAGAKELGALGLASHINEDLCIGCGLCVPACPHSAIELDTPSVYAIDLPSCVGCGACQEQCSHDAIEGDRQEYEITSACNGCGKCVPPCPHDAIKIVGKMAVIDQEKCQKCGECFKACRRGAILMPRLVVVAESCESCGECYAVCEHDAVRRTLHTATLDASRCDVSGACVEVCPQDAIAKPTAVPSTSWGALKRQVE